MESWKKIEAFAITVAEFERTSSVSPGETPIWRVCGSLVDQVTTSTVSSCSHSGKTSTANQKGILLFLHSLSSKIPSSEHLNSLSFARSLTSPAGCVWFSGEAKWRTILRTTCFTPGQNTHLTLPLFLTELEKSNHQRRIHGFPQIRYFGADNFGLSSTWSQHKARVDSGVL